MAYFNGKQILFSPRIVKNEWDIFWDVFQDKGERTNYNYAFYSSGNSQSAWNDDNFKPKYDLNMVYAQNTFYNAKITNLKQILIDCGVSLNITATQMYYTFCASAATHIPEVGSTKCTNIQNCFLSCGNLVSIDKLILSNTANCTCNNALVSCPVLEEIRFSEDIRPVGLNLSNCTKLSHDSLMSLINALADKSGDVSGTTWSVNLGATNLEKLSEDEKAIMDDKGWQYS